MNGVLKRVWSQSFLFRDDDSNWVFVARKLLSVAAAIETLSCFNEGRRICLSINGCVLCSFTASKKRSFFQRAVKSRKNNWEGKREVWCETYLLEVGIKVLVMILTHKSKLLRSAVYPFEVSGVFNYFWSGSTSFSQAPSRVKVVSICRSHNVICIHNSNSFERSLLSMRWLELNK